MKARWRILFVLDSIFVRYRRSGHVHVKANVLGRNLRNRFRIDESAGGPLKFFVGFKEESVQMFSGDARSGFKCDEMAIEVRIDDVAGEARPVTYNAVLQPMDYIGPDYADMPFVPWMLTCGDSSEMVVGFGALRLQPERDPIPDSFARFVSFAERASSPLGGPPAIPTAAELAGLCVGEAVSMDWPELRVEPGSWQRVAVPSSLEAHVREQLAGIERYRREVEDHLRQEAMALVAYRRELELRWKLLQLSKECNS